MQDKLDRRTFLGASLAISAASGALLAPSALLKLVTGPDAPAQVMAILRQHLQLSERHMAVVTAFTESLRAGHQHLASGAEFQAKLDDTSSRGELEVYILQEFVASSNYVAFASGQVPDLALLPLRGKQTGQHASV